MKSVQAVFEPDAQTVTMMAKMNFEVSGSNARQSHSESFPVLIL